MSHTYCSNLIHCVFTTKERRSSITPEIAERLHPYLGGIARENQFVALAIGGTSNHVHMLLSIPAVLPVAKAVQYVKGGSSKWIHETFPGGHSFAWQEGYGAFSVGISVVADTIAYIERQEQHHRKASFEEEFIAFLKKHGIQYDERYVFG